MTTVVQTSYGTVSGSSANGVRCFYNIPFAAAPVGSLRFSEPQKHSGWNSTLECGIWERREAVQNFAGSTAGEGVPFNRSTDPALFSSTDLPQWMSEDCLYLSVFAPQNIQPGEKLPCMYWIHVRLDRAYM